MTLLIFFIPSKQLHFLLIFNAKYITQSLVQPSIKWLWSSERPLDCEFHELGLNPEFVWAQLMSWKLQKASVSFSCYIYRSLTLKGRTTGKVLVWPMDFSHWINLKVILDELHFHWHEITILVPSTSFLFDHPRVPLMWRFFNFQ